MKEKPFLTGIWKITDYLLYHLNYYTFFSDLKATNDNFIQTYRSPKQDSNLGPKQQYYLLEFDISLS